MTHFSFSFWTWIWFFSVRLQSRQSERVGIITMKFLRTRIHFLSDVSWGNLSFLGLSFPDLVASEIFGSGVWGLSFLDTPIYRYHCIMGYYSFLLRTNAAKTQSQRISCQAGSLKFLHLRWVSPDSLLSESIVFSVIHIKTRIPAKINSSSREEIRFPY